MIKEAIDIIKSKKVRLPYKYIIIDEAHNILSTSSERESQTWKDYRLETFEEIIKRSEKNIYLSGNQYASHNIDEDYRTDEYYVNDDLFGYVKEFPYKYSASFYKIPSECFNENALHKSGVLNIFANLKYG